MKETFDKYKLRKLAEYAGTATPFDASGLAPQFVPYFESGQRVEAHTAFGLRRGYVSVTTGHRPCFLLVYSTRATGSPITLGYSDAVMRTFDKYRDGRHSRR